MKLGIMQPYFLPYIGYFSLIKHTDKFILLDTVQFIKHGWIERNRILKPNLGWQYIKVPLIKHKLQTLIKDIIIKTELDWQEKIIAQLNHYKKAPYYYDTVNVINNCINIETNSIVELNKNVLEKICNYLGIKKKIEIFSEMKIEIEKPKAPDEWALNICKAIGNVREYINFSGGKSFFDKQKYERENIKLLFHEIVLKEYNQKREGFERGLSILDLMMFNSPKEINKMLDNYNLSYKS